MERKLTSLFRDKNNCCGCGACVQKCPNRCISFKEDQEGFLYPFIDQKKCIGCRVCLSVCPFRSIEDAHSPQRAFAAYNRNEIIRRASSSGGVFSSIAEYILDKGGVVFGAMFDEQWNVVHGFIENAEELPKLRASKYVQSFIGKSFATAERFLQSGRLVLFCGTPCQIAGLKTYLRKDYENLVAVDMICHGVPSPKLWRWYLQKTREGKPIVDISFRNKDNGWKMFNFAINYSMGIPPHRAFHRDDPYMMAFLNNLSLRPSCSSCKAKEGRSTSDLTIADFWNIDKVLDGADDDKGINLVLENTPKGALLLQSIQNIASKEVDFFQSIQYNSAWNNSYPMHPKRVRFFSSYQKHEKDFDAFVTMILQQDNTAFSKRIKRRIKHLFIHPNK